MWEGVREGRRESGGGSERGKERESGEGQKETCVDYM